MESVREWYVFTAFSSQLSKTLSSREGLLFIGMMTFTGKENLVKSLGPPVIFNKVILDRRVGQHLRATAITASKRGRCFIFHIVRIWTNQRVLEHVTTVHFLFVNF